VSSLTKLFQITCREGRVIMCVQFLEAPPLKFGRAKKRANFGAISDNFRLLSRISPEWIDICICIQHLKKLDQPQPLLRWRKEIWWTLVNNQKSSRGACWPTQVNILRETTFRPLGATAPSNFLHALEIDQAPHQKNNCKTLNFGLKLSVWAPITSGLKWEYLHQSFPGNVMNFGPQAKKL